MFRQEEDQFSIMLSSNDWQGKKGEDWNTKILIFWEQKSFLDKIKCFYWLFNSYHLMKKLKMVETRFKAIFCVSVSCQSYQFYK